jgi:hypothetical protein
LNLVQTVNGIVIQICPVLSKQMHS